MINFGFETINLPSLTSAPAILSPLFYQKAFEIHKILQKKSSNQEMFAISLHRHAVVIMQILNRTNQCSLFLTVRHIFGISEDDHPPNTKRCYLSTN
jgi:hypothetical protein